MEPREILLGKLDEVAPSAQHVAVCIFGPAVYAKQETRSDKDVLIVCDEYPNGLRAHLRLIDGQKVRYLIADRNLMESDIRKGALGDFLTEDLLYPYQALTNAEYFENLSLEGRTRIVKEEARDLVLEYGEMCRGLVAKPEFFGLSRLRKRARVFIPSMDDYLKFLEPPVRERNISSLRESFRKAISTMGGDVVELDGDNAVLSDAVVDRWLKYRTSEQVVNILRQSQQAFHSYITRGRAVYLNLDLLARELYNPLRIGVDQALLGIEPENPKDALFLRTSEGLVSFSERTSLEEIVSTLRPRRQITISPLAGVLNEVFLVTVGDEQYVAKKFTDWHGFKWFTLNIVSFGSKLFAVSGKSRMANEYGINRYLAKKGLNVPEVIYASVEQRILIQNYIPGTALNDFAKQIVSQTYVTGSQAQLAEELGETLARVHKVGVSIGDAKPENFVAKDDEIFTVDLEQAGKRGDYAWDIAELLFYTGHYSAGPSPTRGLTGVIDAFIRGYLRKGESAELRRAAGVRYARVFSLWAPAPVVLEITRKLREAK
jgi:tRNA A-37 threonylcarbamoyl transferase component Bud32